MNVFLSMLFSKLDFATKRYSRKGVGHKDFGKLDENTKVLRDLDKSMTRSKMDVISFAEIDSHAEFVEWQDAGCRK